MKKILMVCNYFAPDNKIAAVRVTKLAKYFYEQGYEVTAIAEKNQDDIEDEILRKDANGIKIIRIDNSAMMLKFFSLYQKAIAPIKSKRFDNLDDRMRINRKTGKFEFYPFQTAYPMLGSLDYIVDIFRQYDLSREARKYLREHTEMDYIFTSYGNFFGIFLGDYMHKKNKDIPWIVDIRDAICNYKFTPQYVRWLARLLENHIWKNADCITAVSKGLCRNIPRKYWKKVHCITNGYDKKDREGIYIDKRTRNKLRFAYTGGMYGGIRDLSPLFSSISTLAKNKIEVDKIEFCFAGKESAYQIFRSQAQKYGLDNRCIYYGKITRKEALQLQMESDILIVVASDFQANIEGVLTGKALEYMSANKPIIAIINGDVEHSELGEIIRNAKLGFTYEAAHYKRDNKALCQYLLSKYKEFIEEGRLEHCPNIQLLRKYDYRYIGEKMIRTIEAL